MTLMQFVLVAAIAAFFVYLCTWPLWHTDLWGHLAYGRLIWQSGEIPKTEPFMWPSKDVPMVDTAWLTQLGAYHVYLVYSGEPALHVLFAASITACLVILAWRFQDRSRSSLLTLIGLTIYVAVSWEHLQIIRPQLAGVLCYVALWSLLTRRRWRRTNWIAVPSLFALWANLHGSFLIGLATIGCFLVGHAGDLAWRTRRIVAPFSDKQTYRYLVLFLLASAAVLLNPYGPRLYVEVFHVSSNPNLAALVEWGPLTLRMRQGCMFALAALVLMVVYRLSPRRVSLTEILLLFGLGAATLWSSRMIVWFAPVAAYYVTLHTSAILKSRRRRQPARAKHCHLSWTLASVIAVCGALLCNPLAAAMLFGRSEAALRNVSPYTPLRIARYVSETNYENRGPLFNTYEWGDYFVWAKILKPVFVASHAHLVPEPVWQDYLKVINADPDSQAILDNYAINTIAIDKAQHSALIAELRRNTTWRLGYEDDIGAVFHRRR